MNIHWNFSKDMTSMPHIDRDIWCASEYCYVVWVWALSGFSLFSNVNLFVYLYLEEWAVFGIFLIFTYTFWILIIIRNTSLLSSSIPKYENASYYDSVDSKKDQYMNTIRNALGWNLQTYKYIEYPPSISRQRLLCWDCDGIYWIHFEVEL